MKKSIWIIDDDEIYQMIIRKLIARAKIFEETFFFNNAVEALNTIKITEDNLPSTIFLDINMPAIDGWQFLERLEKIYPSLYTKTNVYIVTSSIAYSDKEKIKEFPGISGFLSKPLNIDILKEIGESEK
ncbi:MAG: response regulator [Christiangramia sp.]